MFIAVRYVFIIISADKVTSQYLDYTILLVKGKNEEYLCNDIGNPFKKMFNV